jgi:hypothetical protein
VTAVRWSASAVLATAACAALTVGWVAAVDGSDPSDTAQFATVLTIVLLGTQLAGVRITGRRPDRWTGVLIQAVGLEAVAGAGRQGDLGWAVPVLAVAWLVLSTAPALLVWDRVTVLQGAGPGRWERWLRWVGGAAIAACVLLAGPVVAAADGRMQASPLWWNMGLDRPTSTTAAVLMGAHVAAATVAVLCAVAALVGRYRRTLPQERAANRPAFAAALAWGAATLVARWVSILDPDPFLTNGRFVPAASLLIITLPLVTVTALAAAVVWFELVVPRLRRTEAGVVLARRPEGVRDLVRWSLSDPSARPLFPAPDGTGWVDPEGRTAPVDRDDPDRALTVFHRSGGVVAAIEHDAQLAAHPDAVELVGTVAGLALEEMALAARTNADVARTRRLTARLVGAADEPRRELAEALRRGPVHRLRRIGRTADTDGDLNGVADELQSIAGEVRELSLGLLPPALEDRGLRAALPDAAVDCGRQPPAVEVTAYLVARDDPAATVTRSDGRLEIVLSRPPTQPSLLDRIDVLGGRIDGTRIVLPVEG